MTGVDSAAVAAAVVGFGTAVGFGIVVGFDNAVAAGAWENVVVAVVVETGSEQVVEIEIEVVEIVVVVEDKDCYYCCCCWVLDC